MDHLGGEVLRIDPLSAPFRSSLNYDYQPTQSDVVWGGQDYVIAWRYPVGGDSVLASMRVARDGTVFDRRGIAAGVTRDLAVALNRLGDVVVVTSESSRLRFYLVSEMSPFPPATPLPPGHVHASLSGRLLTVSWDPPAGEILIYTSTSLVPSLDREVQVPI